MNKLVKDLMTKNLLTITTDTPFTEACRRFKTFHVHHLPVVNKVGEVIGMFSANDALEAYNDKVFNRVITEEKTVNDLIKIDAIMSDFKVYTVNSNDPVDKAMQVFKQYSVHSVPVVDDGKLVGILTSTDILRTVALHIPIKLKG